MSWIAHFPWATLSDFIKHTRDWIVILMEVNFEGSCFAIHGLPYLRLNLKTIGGRCIADPISRDILIQKFCPTWDTLSTKVWERQYPAADREDRELHIIVHQLQRHRKHSHRQKHTNTWRFLSPSGDLGIGLVWDNHPDRTTGPHFGLTVEILFKVN